MYLTNPYQVSHNLHPKKQNSLCSCISGMCECTCRTGAQACHRCTTEKSDERNFPNPSVYNRHQEAWLSKAWARNPFQPQKSQKNQLCNWSEFTTENLKMNTYMILLAYKNSSWACRKVNKWANQKEMHTSTSQVQKLCSGDSRS